MKKILSVLLITVLLVSCSNKKQSEEIKPEEKAAVSEVIAISGNKPVFKLTQNKVTIEKGATVDPLSYLVAGNYKEVKVVKNVDTNVAGQQEIIYEVGGKQHVLKVEVVDSTQPTLPETAAVSQEQPEAKPEEQPEQMTPAPQPVPHTPAPTPQPQPEPEPEPVVPEPTPEPEPDPAPYRLDELGNSGMEFDTFEEADAWAVYAFDNTKDENGDLIYRQYIVFAVFWSDGSVTYTVDFTKF